MLCMCRKKLLILFSIMLNVILILFNYKVYAQNNTIEIKDGEKIDSNTVITNHNGADIYIETKKLTSKENFPL